jgi:hypothetical protein
MLLGFCATSVCGAGWEREGATTPQNILRRGVSVGGGVVGEASGGAGGTVADECAPTLSRV